MRTALYVDGFNLYYSGLASRPQFRWLDLHALGVIALDETHQLVRVRYFTARVKGGDGDQGGPERQDTYVRALESRCPDLTVHWGALRGTREVAAFGGADDSQLFAVSGEGAHLASRRKGIGCESSRPSDQ